MSHPDWTSRTELLLGREKLDKLKKAHVLVVGLGGVGAYAAESICRAGIGKMTIVDGDVVNPSNLNRQLIALNSTIGESKSDVLSGRLKDINPDLELSVHNIFLRDEETIKLLEAAHYDYVIDAIDTLSPKVYLLYHALQKGYKVVSSMGAGGKMDPTKIHISDISKSSVCRLARTVRKRLGKIGIRKGITVVYSTEEAAEHAIIGNSEEQNKNSTVGTIAYMPAVFGCFVASVVIRDLSECEL
ncbi:ThiF family adenylyltransferase [Saccharicrinis sp. FJH62]|uniref:tRNA threonylcarbamoyladenosine dehydratase n=1 Tax=Saccharicrinis sp. FJH62 TaxID=3344657 RepID=UPI0035D4417D